VRRRGPITGPLPRVSVLLRATQVMLNGPQSLGFTGNGVSPMPVMVSSTTTGFVFEFEDSTGGWAVLSLSGAPATLNVSFVTVAAN
jgi:hypothetical protein